MNGKCLEINKTVLIVEKQFSFLTPLLSRSAAAGEKSFLEKSEPV
jgi:hypothetical protein